MCTSINIIYIYLYTKLFYVAYYNSEEKANEDTGQNRRRDESGREKGEETYTRQ